MKFVIISYNIAIHQEVMEILENIGIESFTRFEKVQGVGKNSGPHLGDHIWPAVNSAIFVVIDNEKKNKLIEAIKNLRETLKQEGVKAFVLPVEEIT